MTFTTDAWARTAGLRAAIDGSAFLAALGDGTLDPRSFRHYLEQDELYLAGYGRALALLAARSPQPAASAFWATSAAGASVVESALHADLLASGLLPPAEGAPVASPTTLGYVSYLVATAATAPYPVAAAAVLPCFWVYADVAARLAAAARASSAASSAAGEDGARPEHPYARWIATYDAPGFQESAATARDHVDAAAEGAGAATLAAMHEAFATATRYEHLFWETCLERETWELPLA
ncbi:TenA family protein [Kineococcus sp. SYSU DK004]|uniref:TenA family protein n=1 Tax=Kineococcus sp. SYSU DK004 TaxID=3383125 RepID=UPI003D7D196F